MTLHCQLLQAGDLQAVIGDASRNGVGGQQYCGVWSLTSKHRVFNAFGNSYAGLIPGHIRGQAPLLEVVDDCTCALVRSADEAYPVDVRTTYHLSAPCYLDHELIFTDQRDCRAVGADFREVSWCSYTNCPEDPLLHFPGPHGEWVHYLSPRHGVGANIAPAYVPDAELEVWPERPPEQRPFHWHRAACRFAAPYYYGRLGHMVLIFVFGTPQWLRFYCSPTGGGGSLLPGRSCPAWDFEWVIPGSAYRVRQPFSFRVRMIYKPFVSEADVVAEAETARAFVGQGA